MNSKVVYERIREGDYDGLREIAGKIRPSLVREYANGVAKGVANFYRSNRQERQ